MSFLSLLLVTILTLSSCAQILPNQKNLKNNEDFYLASGVARYFLPNIPAWANRSESAGCLREANFYRFDMSTLRSSYGISYSESVQFQLAFNIASREALDRARQAALPLKEMESLFHLTMDRIRSQIFELSVPSFKRVHLIWVDEAMRGSKALENLHALMKKESMDLGHPVFVSLCHHYRKVEKFIKEQQFQKSNVKVFSAELFHPFDQEMNLLAFDRLDLSALFQTNQKIYFYTPNSQVPKELYGKMELINY